MRGLYIHIPFCKSKCNYCGFSSTDCFDELLLQAYVDALITDIKLYGKVQIDTIYIGGGTPTVMSPVMMVDLFERVLDHIDYSGMEWTVEANPESLTEAHVDVFKQYGVSRVSLGVQSTDSEVLKLLGRIHHDEDVKKSVQLIRTKHPECDINLDVIYDIPSVSFDSIKVSLNDIISLNPDHISAYSYSFDTDFLNAYIDDETDEHQMEYVRNKLDENGYHQYEVSNFAKSGHDSKHNINYWQMGEYIGIGAGAHSMLLAPDGMRHRYGKSEAVDTYLMNPVVRTEEGVVDRDDMFKETVVFGLRMISGIDLDLLRNEFDKRVDVLLNRCRVLIDEKLIEVRENRLCATEKGLLLLESVSEFVWSLELH